MAQRQPAFVSEDEYRADEELSPVKHEWFRGEVFAMAGETFNHTTICSNLGQHVRNRLNGRHCRARNGE